MVALHVGLPWIRGEFGNPRDRKPQLPRASQSQNVVSNYHSVEIKNSKLTADEVFARLMKFREDDYASAPAHPTNGVEAVGDTVSWDFDFPLWIGQPQFDAQVNKFDRGRRFASVVTLNNHPLSGYRFWEVQAAAGNARDFVIRTGAVEHPTYANDQFKAWLAGDNVLTTWTSLFQTLISATGGVTVAGPKTVIGGVWDKTNIPVFQALVGWRQTND